MKTTIERKPLLNALTVAYKITGSKNTVPILGHVLLNANGALELLATDLEVSLRTEVPCATMADGEATLNARSLLELCKRSEASTLTVETLENDWIAIQSNGTQFKMMGLDPRSFPESPNKMLKLAEKPVKFTVPAETLADMIDRVIFAVSPDEARYNLSGVFMERPAKNTLRMVATDGHRLSMIDRTIPKLPAFEGSIVPLKALTILRSQLGKKPTGLVTFKFVAANALSLAYGPYEFLVRLVEGEFPDYRGVVPEHTTHQVCFDVAALDGVAERVSLFSNETYHGVKLTLGSESLTVFASSPERGEAKESLNVVYDGPPVSVGLNTAYLRQTLRELPEGEAVLGISDEVSPVVITSPSDEGFKYVIMPMRI